MYDCGQFPGLRLTGAGRDRNNVAGELSRAQSGDIGRLDRFEGAVGNNPLYRRRRVELSTPSRTACVYGYARRVDDTPVVESGDWRDCVG